MGFSEVRSDSVGLHPAVGLSHFSLAFLLAQHSKHTGLQAESSSASRLDFIKVRQTGLLWGPCAKSQVHHEFPQSHLYLVSCLKVSLQKEHQKSVGSLAVPHCTTLNHWDSEGSLLAHSNEWAINETLVPGDPSKNTRESCCWADRCPVNTPMDLFLCIHSHSALWPV